MDGRFYPNVPRLERTVKQCTYCGKEHPDDATICSVDGQPLQDFAHPIKKSGRKPSKHFFIALGVIAIFTLTAVYALIRPRAHYSSAAAACINRLRQINAAKEEWALEEHKTTNDVPTWSDILPYFSNQFTNIWFTNGMPICPSGGIYTIGRVGEPPTCSLAKKWPGQHTLP